MPVLVRPLQHLEIFLGVQHRTGFEERHADPHVRQDLGNRAATCSGPDNDNVIDGGAASDLEHATIILACAACNQFPFGSSIILYRANADEPTVIANPEPEPKGRSAAGATLSWFRDLFLSVLIAIVVILFLYQPVKVEGTSMKPSLDNNERIFINKFVYRFGISDIGRGDTVVFLYPGDTSQVLHQARDRNPRRHRRDRQRQSDRQQ